MDSVTLESKIFYGGKCQNTNPSTDHARGGERWSATLSLRQNAPFVAVVLHRYPLPLVVENENVQDPRRRRVHPLRVLHELSQCAKTRAKTSARSLHRCRIKANERRP